MSRPFHFREFSIEQAVNAQKVGTDSMLLGAWSAGAYKQILDIGTGTGILALMMAQQHPGAGVVAIDCDPGFLEEARSNFARSRFASQIAAVAVSLQHFKPDKAFDLILCNPPYFENSSRSDKAEKNRARHTDELPVEVLYQKVQSLLQASGHFNLVIPYESETRHLTEAARCGLYPARILRTRRDDGLLKRTLVSYSFNQQDVQESEMIVKHSDNRYSSAYIHMTRPFYAKDLGGIQ